ncbi:hypothetical protein [Mesorhizobium caraganae]|uniref:hypothetical protein n=1 Tax=Mesorhizobium caraganae TaxID=483206 RepID=UPI001780E703|nr:hypothetical protein [Mesorhizobium caraganae]
MDLNYDFEMQSIFPKAVWLVPECKGLLEGQKIAHNMKGNYVTAFVDAATAVALWRESPELRSTIIKAGWSTLPYEGEADAGKAPHFLIPKLMEIHTKAASGAYGAEAVRNAVHHLHLFTRKLTIGEILDANGKPTCSDLTRQRMSNARPASKFDANKAVMAMVSDPKNRPARETTMQASPAKPTEAGPGLFGRAARIFGRKMN